MLTVIFFIKEREERLGRSQFYKGDRALAFLIWVASGVATLPLETLRLQGGFLNAH